MRIQAMGRMQSQTYIETLPIHDLNLVVFIQDHAER